MTYLKLTKLVSNYVVLDFETTGFDPRLNEPIQVAAIRYENFVEKDRYVSYIRPQQPIPPFITQLTGISNHDVQHAPFVNDVFSELVKFIGNYALVAHNAAFDMKFFIHYLNKYQLAYTSFSVIDTLALARQYIHSPDHKLPTLKRFLQLSHFDSHEALSDVLVTAALYEYCYKQAKKRHE